MTLTMAPAPKPTWGPAPGFVWTVVVDESWTTDPNVVGRLRCRWSRPSHGVPAVAALDRSSSWSARRPNWWGYCAEHLYGRWMEDGQVVGWRAVKAPG